MDSDADARAVLLGHSVGRQAVLRYLANRAEEPAVLAALLDRFG